jgi:eukaryotic-like serine/threonine-protein kinase
VNATRCGTCDSPLAGAAEAVCPRCALTSALALSHVEAPLQIVNVRSNRLAVEGYQPLYELGRGSMGVVWLARDETLGRLVALKLIAAGADPRFGPRLLREGRAIAQLRHPHIVAVHALGETGGTTFLAMDFLEGGDLDSHLQHKPMPARPAASLVRKMADALAHAHAAGVLHRDLKPSNILLDETGEPHLADFGLAAPLSGAGDLTLPGQVAGTPAFLAPELLAGADHGSKQSDIYGLGAVLYVCLTGRAPFIGESTAAILAQIADGEPPPPRLLNPAVPRDLETLCLKCLEKSPARRYVSAEALRDDLDRFLRDEPLLARPVGRVAKVVRWCRRKPALAATGALAATLVLVLAIGGPIVAWKMARARDAAETSRQASIAAEAKTREQLREALLARSRATRLTGAEGQRFDALAAAEQAAKIRPGIDARDEAIAALTLPDITLEREWSLRQNLNQHARFAPDHDRYTIAEQNGEVRVHRLSDAVPLRVLTGAALAEAGPTFSPNGRWLVVRDAQARVVVWRDERTEPAFVLSERRYVLANSVGGYGQPDAFSPDGRVLASALSIGGATLHATDDGRELRRITTTGQVTHVSFSPDGKWLALGKGLASRSGVPTIFFAVHDVESGEELARASIANAYQTLFWSSDSRTLLLGGASGAELFDARSGARLREIRDLRFTKVMFGPPGTLVAANDGGAMMLWEIATGRPLLSAGLGGMPEMAIDRTGTRIVKGLLQTGRVYQLALSAVARAIVPDNSVSFDNVTNHGGSVLEYSRDGRWLATAVWGEVQLRDAATGRIVAALLLGTSNNHCSARFAAGDESLLVASRELGLIRIAIERADSGVRLVRRETLDAERDFMLADLSPDRGRAVLVSMWSNEAKLVSLDGSTPAVRWKQPGAGRAAFLAGGREVVVNSRHEMGRAAVVVRDALTGAELRPLAGHTHGYSVRASPDGSWLALGTGPNACVLVRLKGNEPAPTLPNELQGAGKMTAFSHDGEWMAGATGSIVCLVRLRDGAMVAHLQVPASGTYIPDLAFSPDDSQISVVFDNGRLVQWDLRALRRELAGRGLDW